MKHNPILENYLEQNSKYQHLISKYSVEEIEYMSEYIINKYNKQEFSIGSKVKVIDNHCNASQFRKIGMLPKGIHDIPDWKTMTFIIGDWYNPITFTHNPDVYGAYLLLTEDGKEIGYVYNHALTKIE